MGEDEKFYAWLDGELSGAEAAEVEARVAGDPELARLAKEDRALRARLSNAFGTVAEQPVPGKLVAALREDRGEIIDLAQPRPDRPWWRPAAPQWIAMAASLGVGVLLGTAVLDRGSDGLVADQGGQLYAQSVLAEGLSTQLASVPNDKPVRIGVTYRNRDGAICRSFTVQSSNGLACRDGDQWRVQSLVSANAEGEGSYRMAAGADPVTAGLIAASIAGEPFDAQAERAAREEGWR